MKEYNYDFPYHDYKLIADEDAPTSYIVGTDNRTGQGSQNKLFVSKSTLLIATTQARVQFNHSENVLQTLIANMPYTFISNIYSLIVVEIAEGGDLYAYFEGVLPEDAGRPE